MANEIGRKLRKLRGTRTQEEVARELGISRAAVANYEQGERIPRDTLKKRIATYYGVGIEELFF